LSGPDLHCVSHRSRVLITLILGWIAGALSASSLRADDLVSPLSLSSAQRIVVARAFAPTLVFHPLENYLPTSSMVPLGAEAGPETWRVRVARYQALSSAEKLQRAAVAYRVFSRVRRGRSEVVVEYWCYYVYNEFMVRGGWRVSISLKSAGMNLVIRRRARLPLISASK